MRRSALYAFVLVVAAAATPVFAVANFLPRGTVVLDPLGLGGDNDRRPEPGESFDLALTIGNEGDEIARAVTGTLTSANPLLTVTVPGPVNFPDMAIGAFGTTFAPHFRLAAAPSMTCGTAVDMDLRVSFTDALGGPRTQNLRFVLFVGEREVLYHQDFDQGPAGWNHDPVSSSGGGEGGWVNAAPQGYLDAGQPAEPSTDVSYPDVSCFYTGQSILNVTGTKGLISRSYDLAGRTGVYLSYYRWFYSNDASLEDSWVMEASGDGGLNWVVVESINAPDNRWAEVSFLLDPLLTLTSDMRFRVIVTDGGVETICEAAIDEMFISTSACNVDPQTATLANSTPLLDDTLDPACTDSDGIPDAGETFQITVSVENTGTAVASNASARLVSVPAQLRLFSPNPVPLGNVADNGGSATASWILRVDDAVTCQSNIDLEVDVTADPPSTSTPSTYPTGFEEDVNQPVQRWFEDFDSGFPAWSVILYGLNNDWFPGLEDCAMNPGTPPTPALNFWYTGSTTDPTDCSVNPYGPDDDSAIRSPRIDTGYVNPQLLELRWNQLLTMTPPPDGDAAEVWMDHDDDGVFTRIARYQGQVTTNGDTLDPAVIDLPNNPEGADLSNPSQFITFEFRFISDATAGGGNPLALGWIVDNAELTWIDGDGRSCDANTCALCQSQALINPTKTSPCKDETVTLDGAVSTMTACPYFGTRQYEWFRNGVPYASGVPSIMVTEPVVGMYTYRLDVTCSTLPGCTSTTTQVLDVRDCTACVATPVIDPAPTEECINQPVTLDAGLSTVANCPAPGTRSFQWYRNATLLPGETNPTYTANESVAGNYLYTVRVSCSSDPTCNGNFDHTILYNADGNPSSLGNVVRGRRVGGDVEMSWTDAQPLAVAWNVYRATAKAAPGTPTRVSSSPWLDLGAINPVPDPHYLYWLRALSCSGLEGP